MRFVSTLLLGALSLSPLLAQSQTKPAVRDGDWPMYNRDARGTRHSPLTQITPANVTRLRKVWSAPVGKDPSAGGITGGSEYAPLVVEGLLYLLTSSGALGLEPETGKQVWSYDVPGGTLSRRGLGYWAGDAAATPRVYFITGRRLIALDARSGQPVQSFGRAGILDIERQYNGSVTVYRDLLLVGTNAAPGAVRAFDAGTGAKRWEFRSVPQVAGDRGFDTWSPGSTVDATAVISWMFSMTLDPERNMLYAVFDSPTPDYYGGARHGHNLFANSIVALEATTGAYKWHYQATHHDIWDYDIPQPPVLLDVRVNGRLTPVLTLAHKTGYMHILDRETGEPVFGIRETQVAPSEHAAFCRALAERSGGLYNAGPCTPSLHRAPGAPPRSTVLFPGSIGGANWGGSAADPELGFVFVNAMDEASIGWMERRTGRDGRETYVRNSVVGTTSRFQWSEGRPDGGGNLVGSGEKAWPCQKPPWGHLVAVNAALDDDAPDGTDALVVYALP